MATTISGVALRAACAVRNRGGREATQRRHAHIVITGGLGNLGTKLARHVLDEGHTCTFVDICDGRPPAGVDLVVSNMVQQDPAWRDAFAAADAVVHLACDNPFPEATWQEAANSMDITFNAMSVAVEVGVPRFVFASSNHVMGGHKDVAPNRQEALTPATEPLTGTKWLAGSQPMDSTPYATAKLAGERLAATLGALQAKTTFYSVRVGWCQPGDNLVETMSAAGTPTQDDTIDCTVRIEEGDPFSDPTINGKWYRDMWLSNPDFVQLFTKACVEPFPGGSGHRLINGMSGNTGMRWDISETKDCLGYKPIHDSWGEAPQYLAKS